MKTIRAVPSVASRRPVPSALALLAMLLVSCAEAVEESQPDPAPDGWAFSYRDGGDPSKSRIDLRSLNEPEAGQSGFVRLTPDGSGFALGDGSPVRFWAIGSEMFKSPPEEIRRHVRFLARMGVNMVRLHARIDPRGPGSKITDVNEKEIDGIWRFVAEAKKQGIYVTISPYYANGQDAAKWGIEGYGSGSLYGLLFFDETLQNGYKSWARALYARPNPYTGLPLARDPTVAIIQVQNEDSILFATMMSLKPAQKVRLGQKFASWLIGRYGPIIALPPSWGDARLADDDFANGKAGLLEIWQLGKPLKGGIDRRAADQLRFYAETQRKFYAEIARFYREDLGCGQLINASNWRANDQIRLDDIERWTYTAADVIAVNKYYIGGIHLGDSSGSAIDRGHRFSQRSVLLNPREMPTNLKQVAGRPMILTESTWVSPLAFQAEGPFLAAVYQSLTGLDGFYWFTANAPEFAVPSNGPPLWKWSATTPTIIGGFPANALLFRKGYVRQGEPVVHEERTLASFWDRQTPLIAEDPAFDPNRDQAPPAPAAPGGKAGAVDPLAFLVGPVEVKYDGDPKKSRVADLSPFIDHNKKRVRSVTGEVVFDYGVGLCTVDAPKAQGACGFLAQAGLIRLKDLSIRSANTYATVIAVSMDDQPLASSKRILIQVGTAARPTGWVTKEAEFKGEGDRMTRGFEVVSTGKAPWRIADTEIGLALKNPGLTRATLLDPAGTPVEDVPLTRVRIGVTLSLPSETMYLILE